MRISCKYLVIICLFYSTCCFTVFSQQDNEQLFVHLVGSFVEKYKHPIQSVSGYTTPELEEWIKTDSTAGKKLSIAQPQVEFDRLGRGKYLRKLTVELVFRDSSAQQFEVANTDTLDRAGLRQVRKIKRRELRGENPQMAYKVFLPVLAVAAGISGIITLFYLRS